ncbi:exodeoxyribonuclease III [Corynebacterium uberis]|uniref:exodeoxyribonuclease III n=1 Tax=Corynebacterium TaxID=1716 RepID=UPI001D09D654|nr:MULTISPECIES: exodeoxyribonuclease III [Corynebacterium]MCZ9309716.1 exodeoxyribonuclease III [Corynebacterium sp. c6VSa_13]UDL73520.1 exodeoxyribonuclease III [Corynebacterium uberis]UDL75600.1 exodeoxyribonuclease III [Corynebacterium uberis]UDL77813.1 exodeoxyribonuclease III [Corynebacterium uberis]UDL80096.1 exodeoxyribonuclease III [Corynebacterium uberis]
MRIATWNVNSARTRADRIAAFLHRHDVDVAALQETKCTDAQFPAELFEDAGYSVAHTGLNQWNGVAILSRVGLEDVETSFPGQPGFAKDPHKPQNIEARALGATCGGVRVWSLYVPNGREIADPHYDYKLRWLWALRDAVTAQLDADPGMALALMGDFNIAPCDEDVWDMDYFQGRTHITEPERAAFQGLLESGLTEVTRARTLDTRYTYWDYTQGRFGKNEGMRIDFQLASDALARTVTGAFIDVEERAGKGASDHAPVVVDYHLSADFDSVR